LFTINTTSKKNPKTCVTSVAIHHSIDMCDRKVSVWTGVHTNIFIVLKLFQSYLTFQTIALKIYFLSSTFHVSSPYHEIQ